MKHPASQELFRYWTGLRGTRAMPDRDEIDPAALSRILADTFILTCEASGRHPFRLAGTRVCALFCRELKGHPFVSLWDEDSRPLMQTLLDGVGEDACGIVVGGAASSPLQPEPLPLELVLLPLAHRSSDEGRLIGALTLLRPPYWLGLEPVSRLAAGSFRNLTVVEPPIAMTLPPPGPERRARLRVLTGGRTD